MNRHSIMRLLPAITIAAAMAACSTGGCYDNQSAIPLAEFRSAQTGAAITLTGLTIHGIGAPHDSALVRPSQTVGSVYLPMRSTHSTTAWCFDVALTDSTTVADTLTLNYQSIPYFASEECGAMYYYRITTFSHTCNLIDSVTVADSLITNADIASIMVYFRTASDDEPGTEAGRQ